MKLAKTMTITHKSGLHARASTKFVEEAARFASTVEIAKDGAVVDGKSVLGLLTLGAELGHEIELRVDGPDAEKALAALADLVERNFDGV